MQFTLVIFSTYKFFTEPLASAKWTLPFFMFKKNVTLFINILKAFNQKYNRLPKVKNNFLLKDIFFTSPQLKITLFNAVFLQLMLMPLVGKTLGNNNYQYKKRKSNASMH